MLCKSSLSVLKLLYQRPKAHLSGSVDLVKGVPVTKLFSNAFSHSKCSFSRSTNKSESAAFVSLVDWLFKTIPKSKIGVGYPCSL